MEQLADEMDMGNVANTKYSSTVGLCDTTSVWKSSIHHLLSDSVKLVGVSNLKTILTDQLRSNHFIELAYFA